MSDWWDKVASTLIIVTLMFVCCAAGCSVGKKQIRSEASEANHGEFYVDSNTGGTPKFRFFEIQPPVLVEPYSTLGNDPLPNKEVGMDSDEISGLGILTRQIWSIERKRLLKRLKKIDDEFLNTVERSDSPKYIQDGVWKRKDLKTKKEF